MVRYPICELWLVSGGLEMDVLDSGLAQLSFFPKMMAAPKEYEEIGRKLSIVNFCGTGQLFLIAISDRIRLLTLLGKAERG